MIIEIIGAGFSNKGAELMLAAIVARLRETVPDAELAIDPTMGPYELRARYGLLQKFDSRNLGRMGWIRKSLFHGGYQRRYGLVPERAVDAILDASGFAFGDVMLEDQAHARAKAFARWRSQNKKIVLLPQAFGPFERSSTRRLFREILESANLVYARDDESFRHAYGLVPKHPGLRQAGDFTNILEGPKPNGAASSQRLAVIVPNVRMLQHGPEAMRGSYISFLAHCIDFLHETGIEAFVLPHDTQSDNDLSEEVRRHAKNSVQVLEERDPLRIKGIIGECWVTIGSRYHGLVSALSQGVPSLGTSWSHKYRALFSDYERANWLLDPTMDPDEAHELLSDIIQNREDEHLHLLNCSSRLKNKTVKMWAEVEELLKASNKVGCK